MKTEVIQVEERGFYEIFLFTYNVQRHLKGFQTNLKHFVMISDGKIPPAPETNQIAGFVTE